MKRGKRFRSETPKSELVKITETRKDNCVAVFYKGHRAANDCCFVGQRAMKKHTQVALNRKRKLAQGPAPKELRLLDFLHKRRDKSKTPAKTLKVCSMAVWASGERVVYL